MNFHMASSTFNGYYSVDEIIPNGLPKATVTDIPVKAKSMGSIPWSSWRPDRVLVEGGVAKFLSIDNVKKFMEPFVKGTIFKQVVDTLEWPLDASFKLSYRVKAWPGSWESYEKFFSCKEELQAYIAHQRDWTRCEDNYFEINLIEHWDLGPEVVSERQLDQL